MTARIYYEYIYIYEIYMKYTYVKFNTAAIIFLEIFLKLRRSIRNIIMLYEKLLKMLISIIYFKIIEINDFIFNNYLIIKLIFNIF